MAWADRIDRVTGAVFRVAAWGALAVVLVQLAVVLLRYALGLGSLWLQETAVYAHAGLFLLAAAFTLARGGHVRVDIVYAGLAPRRKAWIDALGTVAFLFPFAIVLLWVSLPYVARSWALLERSREASGLPLVFLLKTLIPAFAVLMLVQGVAQLCRAIAVLRGAAPAPAQG
ncbi:TRAP transporter small permease subunit [Rhodoplanes sp. TEM]|uniref:TRAP transporter small permease protein n=1 Tax=Rhodoplanes tepidamans TaxID=200616 RepID=A0ABT5J7D9_RHOTP|nr:MULTISPECIES: TRAP transporter small permease subunit [Rhodoplanes]MDC7784940.1 TRAP transporter small permease subunit [Rhodoplanes tepidamans]MDC7983964.1 TRAP transporter small permease subunit [Rhodoplanes sp. TEM]MDQ0353831.1 TRAP-type mannitol/chloroaromatic compound transport system permease small subunit [Rhodoplanes tepidamans]